MNVYLAANYLDREVVLGMGRDLIGREHYLQCRWLFGNEEFLSKGYQNDPEKFNRYCAEIDLDDIAHCDALVYFANTYVGESQGGKSFEMGWALAQNIPVAVVGTRTHVFCYMEQVKHFPEWNPDAVSDWLNEVGASNLKKLVESAESVVDRNTTRFKDMVGHAKDLQEEGYNTNQITDTLVMVWSATNQELFEVSKAVRGE